MSVKEDAINFAIKAFGNKKRKAEPEKDSVLHSIDVGKKLEKYGFDDNVVAAGYLHDVVEDTQYTIEDIKKIFGNDIASLVKGATEEDTTLSWEERKLATINRIKNLNLRHKAVVTCDKLSNTEDLLNLFGRNGKEDFSSFRRGREKKLWYWIESYRALIHNEDENLPIFKDLKKNIDNIINKKEISNNPKHILKYKKEELTKLSSIMNLNNIYNIEIISNKKNLKHNLQNKLNQYLDSDKLFININNINIIVNLIDIDINYLKGRIPSDIYIETLDNYLNLINNNTDILIYLIDNHKKEKSSKKSLERILNLLNNNNINIELIDITNKNIDTITIDLCNNIINHIRNNYLNNINKKLRKRKNI